MARRMAGTARNASRPSRSFDPSAAPAGPGPGTARPRSGGPTGDPLAGVQRVLVDGSNLAFALGGRGSSAMPTAGVVAALRSAVPGTVSVEIVFDGPGTHVRAAANVLVGYAGRRPADRVIEDAVEAQLRAGGPAGTWAILVVSDDRELRDLVRSKGARVAGTAWLAGRISAVSSGRGLPGQPRPRSGTAIGQSRPPAGSSDDRRRPIGRR